MNLPMISNLLVSSPNGKNIEQKLDLGGFGMSRYCLDQQLAIIASEKGAAIHDSEKVQTIQFSNDQFLINSNKAEYRAKVTVGSFGKRSSLHHKINRKKKTKGKNYLGIKYHIKLQFPDDRIELHNFEGGYCGISKVDGDKYCLCYLIDSKFLKLSNNDIHKMEKDFVMKNPYLNKIFSQAEFLNKTPFTISQITFDRKKAVAGHILMMGDAAGNIAPLCGNGMSMAMNASYLANNLIDQYLNNTLTRNFLESEYTKLWNNKFSMRILIGKWLQGLMGKEHLTNLAIASLKKLPKFSKWIVKHTHGQPF
jgi:flavin-dependent dehydrogenase